MVIVGKPPEKAMKQIASWEQLGPYTGVKVWLTAYAADNSPAIQLTCESEIQGTKFEEPLARISVCLAPNTPDLRPNEFVAKTWSENKELREPLLQTGLFTDTGRRIPTGYVMAEIWKLNV